MLERTSLIQKAARNIKNILSIAICYQPVQQAVVVMDIKSNLAQILTEAYKQVLPHATFINFYDEITPDDVLKHFDTLQPQDLVILIQSSSFRLNAFRLRVELFEKSLKVIEHPHLAGMKDDEIPYYIDSLAYDPNYYRSVGNALKVKIDRAQQGIVESGGEKLIFSSPFEAAKLNIGDYTNMKNVGGQFPIGEVFTEAQDLEGVSGRVRIFAFGDTQFLLQKVDPPITLVIEKGRVVDVFHSVPEFDQVLANIRADEEEVWLRELGFGLNRAFSETKTVSDIGTYERVCGIHLSLGKKHGVYKKPQFKRGEMWHHVDVFAVTKAVYLDDEIVYQNGVWQV